MALVTELDRNRTAGHDRRIRARHRRIVLSHDCREARSVACERRRDDAKIDGDRGTRAVARVHFESVRRTIRDVDAVARAERRHENEIGRRARDRLRERRIERDVGGAVREMRLAEIFDRRLALLRGVRADVATRGRGGDRRRAAGRVRDVVTRRRRRRRKRAAAIVHATVDEEIAADLHVAAGRVDGSAAAILRPELDDEAFRKCAAVIGIRSDQVAAADAVHDGEDGMRRVSAAAVEHRTFARRETEKRKPAAVRVSRRLNRGAARAGGCARVGRDEETVIRSIDRGGERIRAGGTGPQRLSGRIRRHHGRCGPAARRRDCDVVERLPGIRDRHTDAAARVLHDDAAAGSRADRRDRRIRAERFRADAVPRRRHADHADAELTGRRVVLAEQAEWDLNRRIRRGCRDLALERAAALRRREKRRCAERPGALGYRESMHGRRSRARRRDRDDTRDGDCERSAARAGCEPKEHCELLIR